MSYDIIEIKAVPKPRQTKQDKWKVRPCVARYRAFADELRLKYKKDLPEILELVFYIKMPNSWSKKKKTAMLGTPHKQKPDIDNLSKSVMDALAKEDSYVWNLKASKVWANHDSITIAEGEPF